MELKESVLVRRSDVLGWAGVSRRVFRKVVESGVLPEVHLPGTSYAYYKREDVLRVFAAAGTETPGNGEAIEFEGRGQEQE